MITTLRSDSRRIKKASEYKFKKQFVYIPAVDEGNSKEKAKGKFYFVKAKKIGSVPGLSFCVYIKIKYIYICMCPSI